MNNVTRRIIAVLTDKQDFDVGDKFGFEINPYVYFDGENLPDDTPVVDTGYTQEIKWNYGTPTPVDGVVGKANKFTGESLHWRNWGFPPLTKFSVSVWVNFAPDDLSGWSILVTNRGDGWRDRLIHIATLDGELNVRLYGAGNNPSDSLSHYTGFVFEPNKWYHVAAIVDTTQPNDRLVVLVNGEVVSKLYFTFDFNMTFYNSIVVGDLYSSSRYPLNGTIMDEMIYCINENAWTVEQAQKYYRTIAYGEYLDNQTIDGSLMLGKNFEGLHPTTPISFISPVIDLGGRGKFVDYGLIQAKGILPSEATTLTFYTRSSSDGENWDDWVLVGSDGKIQSENRRYLQIRVDFHTTDPTQTPILEEIIVMEEEYPPEIIPLPDTRVKADDPIRLYQDLEDGRKSLGVLNNAYDVIIEEVINGEDILTFKLPKQDKKRKEIGDDAVELIVVIGERHYVVKEIIDKRDDDGKLYTEFICEALWTELRDYYCDEIEIVEVQAKTALEHIFNSIIYEEGDPKCEWTVGNVEITKRRTLRTEEWKDVLSLIREVQRIWGGEVLFDTREKKVHLLEKIGKDTGVRFYYNKNLKNIERIIDTYDLITRIYPQGKGGLDITTVNNGIPYLENTEWVDKLKLRKKIIPYHWKDERYTIPENLKEDAQAILNEKSKPRITYKTNILDLSMLTGHEHESFELGDTVTIVDKELFDEEVVNRVVRRKIDVRRPENTEIELSQPIKTLADIRSRAIDEQIEEMIGSDPLSTTDVQQMTVFNLLLNSRADEGINADWVKVGTGFEVANVGFSGDWSFKVTPEYGKENSLTQTVEGVSHRSTYTVSAAVATEGKITRGSSDDAFVGIKVIVHYQDGGKPDVFYLAIPDVTHEGGSDEGGVE